MTSSNTAPSSFFPQRWANTFAYVIKRSFTDLNYYVDVLNSPVKFSLRIVFAFYVVMGILLSAYFGLKTVPTLNQEVAEAGQELITTYPEDLTISWENQQLTSNSNEPITVHFPSTFEKPESWPNELAVLDFSSNEPAETTPAIVFVNQEKLFVNSLQGTWTDTPLETFFGDDNLYVDQNYIQENVPNLISDIQSAIRTLPLFALPFLSSGLFASRLFMIAIDSIILQVLFYFQKKPLPYHKAFQLSLHVLIPVETLNQITQFLYPDLNFPMLTLAYWMIMLLLLWHFRNLQMVKFEVKGKSKG